jgi:hypothetical protein
MKIFLAALYALFFFAMATGITIAYRNAEGLVDADYYDKGNGWFHARERDKLLGLETGRPGRLKSGSNEISIPITTHGRPLEHADVQLFVGNLSRKGYDTTLPMREIEPGIYRTSTVIPFNGIWLLRLDLVNDQFKTSRRWFVEVI